MKMLKIKKARFIGILIFLLAILIVGIVFALLPDEVYINWGDYDYAFTRYIPLIFSGIILLSSLVSVGVGFSRERNKIQTINALMNNIGEDALALEGKIIDKEAARERAKENGASFLAGMLAASLFGIGFFRMKGNTDMRTFVLHNQGMFLYNMVDKSNIHIPKNQVYYARIKEKRNKLVVELMPISFTFTVKTKGLDITKEELIAKIKEVFNNPISTPNTNPNQNV